MYSTIDIHLKTLGGLSPLAILGLEPEQVHDAAAVKRAYRSAAMRHHPDRCGGGAGATRTFQQVGAAYSLLKDSPFLFADAKPEAAAPGPKPKAKPRDDSRDRTLYESVGFSAERVEDGVRIVDILFDGAIVGRMEKRKGARADSWIVRFDAAAHARQWEYGATRTRPDYLRETKRAVRETFRI